MAELFASVIGSQAGGAAAGGAAAGAASSAAKAAGAAQGMGGMGGTDFMSSLMGSIQESNKDRESQLRHAPAQGMDLLSLLFR